MVWIDIYINYLIVGAIGALIGGFIKYLWDCLTLTHAHNLKTTEDRIDEFVNDSKKYFGPLALASGDLNLTLSKPKTSQDYKEKAFYRLSEYLCQREELRENIYFYFPSKKKENDVNEAFKALNDTISKMFDYNDKYIARIIEYYASKKEYLVFCETLSKLSNEYAIFESKIDENIEELKKKSKNLEVLIMDAITQSYGPWYQKTIKEKIKYVLFREL